MGFKDFLFAKQAVAETGSKVKLSPPTSPERPWGEIEAREILPPPFPSSNPHYSLIYPASDDPAKPSRRLLELGLAAAQRAFDADLGDVLERASKTGNDWMSIWPGEHYKLLFGIIEVLKPKVVVEIGTFLGLSALTMKSALPADGKIFTFDIMPWHEFGNTILKEQDFDGQLVQLIDDISEPDIFDKHADLLKRADFVFIDAAKDSIQEDRFITNFSKLVFETKPIFMFDDIRLWNMLKTWRMLDRAKLDLSSFGHWSGTGLVDWTTQIS